MKASIIKCFFSLLLLATGIINSAQAQKMEIDWIEVVADRIIVHYSLEDMNPNHQYLVSLYSSKDNFAVPLTRVSGDVGTEVRAGKERKIIWDVTKELGAYKGNLTFEIRGRVFVPFVKLIDFEEGKVYKRGKNYPLTWTSGNLSGQVLIELYKGQERIWGESNIPNIGKYDWFIQGSIKKGNDYKLKFTNTKDRNDFVYSKQFTIKPKVPLALKVGGLLAVGAGVYILSGASSSASQEGAQDLPGHPADPDGN